MRNAHKGRWRRRRHRIQRYHRHKYTAADEKLKLHLVAARKANKRHAGGMRPNRNLRIRVVRRVEVKNHPTDTDVETLVLCLHMIPDSYDYFACAM